MKSSVYITIISSLISGLLGVIISSAFYANHEKNMIKLNLLHDLVGYREAITPSGEYNRKEFYIALNKVFLVYNDNDAVIDAYRGFVSNMSMGRGDLANESMFNMIKAMAEDSGLNYDQTDKEILMLPISSKYIGSKLK
jgi:hypothetical protein